MLTPILWAIGLYAAGCWGVTFAIIWWHFIDFRKCLDGAIPCSDWMATVITFIVIGFSPVWLPFQSSGLLDSD